MRRKIGISTRIAAGVLAVAVLGSLNLTAADAGVRARRLAPRRRTTRSTSTSTRGSGLLLEEYPNTQTNPYSYVWPYSQAAIAAEDLAGVPGAGRKASEEADRRIAAYEPYWNAGTTPKGYDSYVRPPLGQGGDKFYDDNEWIGLNLIQRYKRTGDRAALARAKEIFALVVHGWDTDPSHPCAGGVFWTQAPWSQDRNTVSNGPGAELGAHLYLLTRDQSYLTWAQRMYKWAQDCMLAPNGLYWDHIDLAGNVEKTQWSYNQGVMLGAGVLLYKATGDRQYLNDAKAVAKASLAFYSTRGPDAGSSRRGFNSIWFKNLLILDSVVAGPPLPAGHAGVRRLQLDTRPATPPPTSTTSATARSSCSSKSGMTQIHALLAWPRTKYNLLA